MSLPRNLQSPKLSPKPLLPQKTLPPALATAIGGIVSAIGKDGTVYIRQQNKLTALDGQTGQPIWEYDAGDIVKTPAIDDSGAIIFQVGQTSIHAVNSDDGKLKWEAAFNVKGGTGICMTQDGKFAIGATGPGSIYSFDGKTGKRKWEYPFNYIDPASGQLTRKASSLLNHGNNVAAVDYLSH